MTYGQTRNCRKFVFQRNTAKPREYCANVAVTSAYYSQNTRVFRRQVTAAAAVDGVDRKWVGTWQFGASLPTSKPSKYCGQQARLEHAARDLRASVHSAHPTVAAAYRQIYLRLQIGVIEPVLLTASATDVMMSSNSSTSSTTATDETRLFTTRVLELTSVCVSLLAVVVNACVILVVFIGPRAFRLVMVKF